MKSGFVDHCFSGDEIPFDVAHANPSGAESVWLASAVFFLASASLPCGGNNDDDNHSTDYHPGESPGVLLYL